MTDAMACILYCHKGDRKQTIFSREWTKDAETNGDAEGLYIQYLFKRLFV